jgi:ATP synthase protein I
MPDSTPPNPVPNPQQRMLRGVEAKQGRMLRGRRESKGNWSALTLLGIVGWSVTLPTLLGTAAGMWIDHHWPSKFPWTVALLFAGLAIGCATAWQHLREDR